MDNIKKKEYRVACQSIALQVVSDEIGNVQNVYSSAVLCVYYYKSKKSS